MKISVGKIFAYSCPSSCTILCAYVGNGSYLLQNSIDAMYGINVEIDTSRGRLLPVLEISAVLHARSCKELHIGLEEPNVFELIFN